MARKSGCQDHHRFWASSRSLREVPSVGSFMIGGDYTAAIPTATPPGSPIARPSAPSAPPLGAWRPPGLCLENGRRSEAVPKGGSAHESYPDQRTAEALRVPGVLQGMRPMYRVLPQALHLAGH